MSVKSRQLSFIQNDNTIFRLLLMGLLIASPSLHYLCFYSTYDPLWLRLVNSTLCLLTLAFSFAGQKKFSFVFQYLTILSFLFINNFLLLYANAFQHVYLFSAITIFIALTLFCKKKWEFIALCVINILASVIAYSLSSAPYISTTILIVLILTITLIAYVSFSVIITYRVNFDKAVADVIELNKTLLENSDELSQSRKNLESLINSMNDIVFEFNEDKICLNTWFNTKETRIIDPRICIGHRLEDVLGAEKARKYNDALDFVIEKREAIEIEYPSDYDSGKWFCTKMVPVFDVDGNYTHKISASVIDITEQKKYADALKENQVLLQEAQVIAKTGNWSYNHQTKESYLSDNLYSLLEVNAIPANVNITDYYFSLMHPEDRENAYQYFSNIHLKSDANFEHRIITDNGNLKYFKALRGDSVLGPEGLPLRTIGVIQDITESKLSEKLIKTSRVELLEAQTIAKIGNWKWDIQLNKVAWSEEINNIFEVDKKGANEGNFLRLLLRYVHPNDRITLRHRLSNITNLENKSFEYRIISARGNVKHLSMIAGKLIYRENGTLRKVIGTLQDVSERKQAEMEYQRTENKYKLVLETIKTPAVSVNRKGVINFCNTYMAEMLGYTQKDLLGKRLTDFFPRHYDEIFRGWFANNTFEAHFTTPIICKNGDQRLVSWQNTVSYDENGLLMEVTGIGEDITEREKATQDLITAKEQAEKSSRFKSEFLSTMSHEIRTPMNAVIGTTNLLLSENPRPEQLEYLNTLKFSGENLLAIINDILDYNKIEAGKLELNKIPFNIYHLLQKIKQTFYAKAAEKDLEIKLEIDDTIPAHLLGDQIRLGQVLNNLLSNAIKFTHNGHVAIRLNTEGINTKSIRINFSVLDTGIGIDPKNLQLIFDPFVQETQTSDNNYGGTGLGLAITKRIIGLHNSSIKVQSEPGVGTEFSFNILFEIAMDTQKPETAPVHIITANTTTGLQGMRVLLVDDNKMNLLIASKFLKKWQVIVDEAQSGAAAIQLALTNTYDVIIMDLQMPEMDGFEATAAIQQTHPNIPVIALTADAMPETHSKALSSGMADYLTKPFVPQVLFEKIARYYLPLVK